jgi:hypothetical protein
MAPSDSDRDCPSRRDSESSHVVTHLAPLQCDSESGGSHSPSPRASRKRQVPRIFLILHVRILVKIPRTPKLP